MNEVNHQRIKSNGIWIHVAEQGTGPLVLLLHGFPENWYGWRHQISFLANHGYHVVAPDLRGYGDSDSPVSPSSYTVFHIVGDLIGLIDHFGKEKVKRYTKHNLNLIIPTQVLVIRFSFMSLSVLQA